ncbi:hypothetical protein A7P25_06525 [Achromobacter xylosoxidans]|nr:hypothetical protein A7P25_06525 [Achromobacter xylosoxidans]
MGQAVDLEHQRMQAYGCSIEGGQLFYMVDSFSKSTQSKQTEAVLGRRVQEHLTCQDAQFPGVHALRDIQWCA